MESDIATDQSFEIERLLNKRIIKRGRKGITQYLVRWRGYGLEHDQWYNVADLDNAKKLIDDYESESNTQ